SRTRPLPCRDTARPLRAASTRGLVLPIRVRLAAPILPLDSATLRQSDRSPSARRSERRRRSTVHPHLPQGLTLAAALFCSAVSCLWNRDNGQPDSGPAA